MPATHVPYDSTNIYREGGREGGREEGRIQKVALNLLKIEYVQVETPKFPRPCTLACNCKIIRDSEFDQVGGLPRKFRSYPFGEACTKIMLNFNFTRELPVTENLSEKIASKRFKS